MAGKGRCGTGRLAAVRRQLATVLATARQGAILREGMHVVLVGQPNVGKSSLMNALAGDEIAIVTDIAGTAAIPCANRSCSTACHCTSSTRPACAKPPIPWSASGSSWLAGRGRADVVLLLVDGRDGVTAADAAIWRGCPSATTGVRPQQD